MGRGAHVKKSENQETKKTLGTPNKSAIVTTETLKLLLKRRSDNTNASNINGGNGHPGAPLRHIILLVDIS